MVDFTYAKVKQLVVHFVGNKAQEEGYEVAKNGLTDISEDLNRTLISIFCDGFQDDDFFHFTHETSLDFNEVYTYSNNIFTDNTHFLEDTESIVKHLYSESTHPNIKSGDVWIFELEGCVVDGNFTNAIGIFKVENKEVYVKNDFSGNNFTISYDTGVTGTDLDKGCFIFNDALEEGFKVLVLSRLSKNDSIYWKDRFLAIEKTADEKFYTESFVHICTDYIKQKEDSLMEKASFVKATSEYMQSSEILDVDAFTEKTIENPVQQAEFKTIVENFEQENNFRMPKEFQVDEEKAEKLSKKVRKTLKLGRNMTLTIKDLENLNEDDFVQGYDQERGRNYMIVYFDE